MRCTINHFQRIVSVLDLDLLRPSACIWNKFGALIDRLLLASVFSRLDSSRKECPIFFSRASSTYFFFYNKLLISPRVFSFSLNYFFIMASESLELLRLFNLQFSYKKPDLFSWIISLLEKFQLLFFLWLIFFWVWVLLSMLSSSFVTVLSFCFYLPTTFPFSDSTTFDFKVNPGESFVGWWRLSWWSEEGRWGAFWLFLTFYLSDLGKVGVCLEDCSEIFLSFSLRSLNFSTASSNDFIDTDDKLIYLNSGEKKWKIIAKLAWTWNLNWTVFFSGAFARPYYLRDKSFCRCCWE